MLLRGRTREKGNSADIRSQPWIIPTEGVVHGYDSNGVLGKPQRGPSDLWRFQLPIFPALNLRRCRVIKSNILDKRGVFESCFYLTIARPP